MDSGARRSRRSPRATAAAYGAGDRHAAGAPRRLGARLDAVGGRCGRCVPASRPGDALRRGILPRGVHGHARGRAAGPRRNRTRDRGHCARRAHRQAVPRRRLDRRGRARAARSRRAPELAGRLLERARHARRARAAALASDRRRHEVAIPRCGGGGRDPAGRRRHLSRVVAGRRDRGRHSGHDLRRPGSRPPARDSCRRSRFRRRRDGGARARVAARARQRAVRLTCSNRRRS